jgi:glycine C-acetyltransferase
VTASEQFYEDVQRSLDEIDAQGLTKRERILVSAQGPRVRVRNHNGREVEVLNFCANNYLGLAGDPRLVAAAQGASAVCGAGLASVRFICGTQDLHKNLERATADWLGFEDAILFAACFDANGAVFEPLFEAEDAIVSDSLNHASIIDGVRLSKARRRRFTNGDMDDLEAQLKAARAEGARRIVIATDGVFSMDGFVADLPAITALADRYEALVMVDDCHATGHIGPQGRGTGALHGVAGRIDILTGTYGKTLGGAMGGFVCARRSVVELLRQRARPYLFSNSLAPAVVGTALEAVAIARSDEGEALRSVLAANAASFRREMLDAGFALKPGATPIVPVMLGDAHAAQALAWALQEEGVFVTGFAYPVVPKGEARIRVQLSAAHTQEDIDAAVRAFARARELAGLAA